MVTPGTVFAATEERRTMQLRQSRNQPVLWFFNAAQTKAFKLSADCLNIFLIRIIFHQSVSAGIRQLRSMQEIPQTPQKKPKLKSAKDPNVFPLPQ